jgi:hypothetical protein
MANIKDNLTASRAPTVTDDATPDANGNSYGAGSWWGRPDTGENWMCQDPTIGAAKWMRTASVEPRLWLPGQARVPEGFISSTDGQQTPLRFIALLFSLNRPRPIDSIFIDVVTGQPGAAARTGLYRVNEQTVTADLLKDAGEIGLTSTGNKPSASLGLGVLPADNYLSVGILKDAATMPTLRAVGQSVGGIYGRAKGNNLNIPAKGLASIANSAYPSNMPQQLLLSGASAGNVLEWHNSADCFLMSLALA